MRINYNSILCCFWCDSAAGDDLRKERMIAAITRAMRYNSAAARPSTPVWDRQLKLIVAGIQNRRPSEVEDRADAPSFTRQRDAFRRLTRRLRLSLRSAPRSSDRAIFVFLTRIHANFEDQSYHGEG